MKLTLATPTFGDPPYLTECIQSVKNQSVTIGHIVCGGDLKFGERSGSVQIINKTPDPGMVQCWNTAANSVETDYLGFLADDNTLEPGYAELMIEFLENNPECDLVFCNQHHMDSAGKVDYKKSEMITRYFGRDKLTPGIIQENQYETILTKNAIPLEACIIRNKIWSLYGPFNEKAEGSFDQAFLYKILLSGTKIAFIEDYLMNFRWHEQAYSVLKKQEHITGSIWTNETLMEESKQYFDFFKAKSILLKGTLLRFDLHPRERFYLMLNLLKEKGGIQIVAKNTLAKLIGKK